MVVVSLAQGARAAVGLALAVAISARVVAVEHASLAAARHSLYLAAAELGTGSGARPRGRKDADRHEPRLAFPSPPVVSPDGLELLNVPPAGRTARDRVGCAARRSRARDHARGAAAADRREKAAERSVEASVSSVGGRR